MDKQKQIEEMAKEIKDNAWENIKEIEARVCAEALYNAGYRKIPRNEVVLTREQYDELVKCGYNSEKVCKLLNHFDEKLQEVRKETAEKFAERLKEQLSEWLDDNEDLNFKINKAVAMIDLIGVESKDGEIISLGMIDEICKEITEGIRHEGKET